VFLPNFSVAILLVSIVSPDQALESQNEKALLGMAHLLNLLAICVNSPKPGASQDKACYR
jgi:hypothetical protein